MINNYCVYKHISPSEKVYIGITSLNPTRRWKNGEGYKNNLYFYRAIKKYGWNNFRHEIIHKGLTKEEACKEEQGLIDMYDSTNPRHGYNLSLGGECSASGMRHTEEYKQKMSQLFSKENNPFYGCHHTEEAKQKMSQIHKGKTISEEQKEKITNSSVKAPIVCVELNKFFVSIRSAEKDLGIDHSNIIACLKGRQKTAGGYHWKYVAEDDIKNYENMKGVS